MSGPTVARLHERQTKSKRIVLIARVAADVPAGAYVALVDVRGELFLEVVEYDDPKLLTAKHVQERIKQ